MADKRRKQTAQRGLSGGRPSVIVGHSPVLIAYYDRDLDKLRDLLVQDEANLADPGGTGRPLCFLAAREDRLEVLRLIYNIGGDLRYLGHVDQDGETCLFAAIRSGSLAAARFLLSVGFDPDFANSQGQTPLHASCIADDASFVQLLLLRGASANARDASGNLPLHRACQENQPHMARLLLPRTLDINARGAGNRTALHFAALAQSLELLSLLLAAGADCRVHDFQRKSPMDIVLSLGNLTTVTGLAEFFNHRVKGPVPDLESLQHSPDFGAVLENLQAIDDDLENPVEGVRDFHGLQMVDVTLDVQTVMLQKIKNREKLDFMQFRGLLRLLVSGELSDLLVSSGALPEFAESVAKHVLFREDLEMLRLLMFGTTLWRGLAVELERQIVALYNECGEIGSTGMQNVRQRYFVDRKTGQVSESLMLKFFSKFLNMPNMQHAHQHASFMRSPIRTLCVWSVLTGRFQLTEDLLKGEQFDILPLGLFCIRLLRRLAKSRQMPRPSKRLMNNVADKVESICMKLLRAVDALDTSEKKVVSINYIRQKMPVFSNLTCMSLAADSQCEAFMVMNTVQTAVDREWYQRLFHLAAWRRELLILLGIVPFNPLLYLALRVTASNDASDAEVVPGLGEEPSAAAGAQDPVIGSVADDLNDSQDSHDDQDEDLVIDDKSDGSDHDERISAENQHAGRVGDREQLVEPEADGRGLGQEEHKAAAPRKKSRVAHAIRNYGSVCTDFYLTPCVRFHFHVIAHLVFLGLFSYVMLVKFRYAINAVEIAVYVFVLGFLMEELHEMNQARRKGSMKGYFTDGWNLIDNAGILLCLLGFGMRLVRIPLSADKSAASRIYAFSDEYFWWTRFVLMTSCLVFWLRLLYVSTVMENLGPKLKMISVMIRRDLVPFLIMLAIMMFGFGLVIHGLLFPNGFAKDNPVKRTVTQIFQSTFRTTFYAMVGDYSMDLITGNDCEKRHRCPHPVGKVVVPNIIMTVYIVIVTILLLNLIVASFSNTVDEIHKKSFAMWQFERYDLLEEFRVRSPLPPPLNILGEVARWVVTLVQLLRRQSGKLPFRRTRFNKRRIVKFLTLQAFALRGRRKKLVGELEAQDPSKLLPEIGRQLKRAELQLQFLQKACGEDEPIEAEDEEMDN